MNPRFEIGAELGHGAYSIVYEARLEGVRCALKVPRVRASWTRDVYREAVALARVRHAGLPAVLEVGETDGLPYLAMELVEGETLADKLARGPMAEGAALALCKHLVEALGAVHAAGLVHRDVKPRNLIVERTGRLRLVDFGFATPIERAGVASTAAGTRGYAAPEQFRAPTRVDARADLYAVGAVLFECISGRLPERDLAEDGREWAKASLSKATFEILDSLLATSPSDRYPDAQAMLADLDRLDRGLHPFGARGYSPTAAQPPIFGREAELRRIRHLITRLKGGTGGVLVVSGVSGSGKSRLLNAAIEQHERLGGICAVSARCREGDPPLAALRRIIEGVADLRRGVDHDGAWAKNVLKTAAAVDLAPLAALIAPPLQELFGSTDAPESAALSFVESAAELIVRIADAAGQLLILVDDVQWADPASRDVLLRIVHRAREAPLGLILAGRSEGKGAAVLARFTENVASGVHVLAPAAFGPAEISALVHSHLGVTEIDPRFVAHVETLAGDTPLGVIEVLRAFLDTGALRPRLGTWTVDAARAERVALPSGARALLGRRIDELPPATRRVLECAAIIGSTFEDDLLAAVVGIAVDDLDYALADARRAALIQPDENRCHRFVHDSARDRLLSGLSDATARELHERVAQRMEAGTESSFGTILAIASHYEQADPLTDPTRAYESVRAAANLALERYDNETAVRYFEYARKCADRTKTPLDAAFFQSLGEAYVRLGAPDESLAAFERALQRADGDLVKASILGRIAWAHQTCGNTELAWSTLERAFGAVGSTMPTERVWTVVQTLGTVVRRGLASRGVRQKARPAEEAALLCELHYQGARLAIECDLPMRPAQSILQALELSAQLPPSAVKVRARAMGGFLQTGLGRADAGRRDLANAQSMAAEVGDPSMTAFCIQLRAVAACYAGQYGEALALLAECIDRHGHWLELGEYCLNVVNLDALEQVRGRPTVAWSWIERAVERVRSSHRGTPVFSEMFVHRVNAGLASLGREPEPGDRWLRQQLAQAEQRGRPVSNAHRMMSWGALAKLHLERRDFGSEFEALVARFEAEKRNPRFAQPILHEYYLIVAHARLEQVIAAPPATRPALKPKLAKALSDLRLAAKTPLFRAHRVLIDAWYAYFEGKLDAARASLAKAEALAVDEACVWVLSGVARLRAHMLMQQGNREAALEQARAAESYARDHGAEARARVIRGEFGLAPLTGTAPTLHSSGSSPARKQLDALVELARASARDLRPEPQAMSILDELVRDLEAERATLLFQWDPGGRTQMILGRARDNQTFFGAEGWREAVLNDVRMRVEGARRGDDGVALPLERGADRTRFLAAPLTLQDSVVGAVLLERGFGDAPFSDEARDLLDVLRHQIPLALQIAHLLAERERLHASLQQAQKMEAVGRLAGGVAHDFNNMVAAIRVSLDSLSMQARRDGEAPQEIEIISQATLRASQLTRQLLTFSRHRPNRPGPVEIHDVVSGLEPMLQTLVGKSVRLEVYLDAEDDIVRTDRGALEQAIVNLAVNARDAMSEGGRLRIETRTAHVGDVPRNPLAAGEYILISVTDTGHGMNEEVLERVFDPFFSTKGEGVGTGLGLTTVYAFAKNSGGIVEVESEVGQGTTFRIHLPIMAEDAPPESARSPVTDRPPRSTTILVVDDEPLLRRSVQTILEREGYTVVSAESGSAALSLVEGRLSEISLALVDVRMPGMSGPELAERFTQMQAPFRIVFMSGYSPGNLPDLTGSGGVLHFLEKPFNRARLLEMLDAVFEPVAARA